MSSHDINVIMKGYEVDQDFAEEVVFFFMQDLYEVVDIDTNDIVESTVYGTNFSDHVLFHICKKGEQFLNILMPNSYAREKLDKHQPFDIKDFILRRKEDMFGNIEDYMLEIIPIGDHVLSTI